MSFLENLKQKKIARWTLAYLASAWLLMQLIDVLGARWGISDAAARLVDVSLVIGLGITLVVAWYHGDEGQQRIGGKELLIIAALVVLGGLGASVLTMVNPSPERTTDLAHAEDVSGHTDDTAPWIAVVPFRASASSAEVRQFAGDVTGDITAGLSRFSHLPVISRSATEAVWQSTPDLRQLGDGLGARYIMEGEVREAGGTIRLTVQLTDAEDGTTVWSERYDRDIGDGGVLAIQDELTDVVVATVADVSGVVTRTLATSVINRKPETLSPYEAVLQWSFNRQRAGPEEHLKARIALERAVALRPDYAVAWACLAHVYVEEYMSDYNVLPGSLDRALQAARQAVDLDPTSSLAQYSLAVTHYFRQEVREFRVAAERAIALNERDASSIAMLGILISYSGDWERGVALSKRAMHLNPNHPGYYRFNSFFDAYRRGDYESAPDVALRVDMPEYIGDPLVRTLAYVRLGDMAAAKSAAEDLQRLFPDPEWEFGRLALSNWFYNQPELLAEITGDLDRAGLKMSYPE